MAKTRGAGEAPEITIKLTKGDEPPDPNSTLYGLLRDGEKFRPGDPKGTLLDRLGAEVQAFMAHQSLVARHRRTAVKGSITLKMSFVSGPDGSHAYAVEADPKRAKIPPGTSMTFADEDGELTGRPVEPLTEEMYRREHEAAHKPSTPDPKVGTKSPV